LLREKTMAYNVELYERVTHVINDLTSGDFEGKKMFGGVGYLINGNMACGILGDHLIVRVGKDGYKDALHQQGVKEFLNNGRPMTGWVMLNEEVLSENDVLFEWVSKGIDFVLRLPGK